MLVRIKRVLLWILFFIITSAALLNCFLAIALDFPALDYGRASFSLFQTIIAAGLFAYLTAYHDVE